MKGNVSPRSVWSQMFRGAVAALCLALIAFGDPALLAGQTQQAAGTVEEAPKIWFIR